jgi:hypothetical protein
MQAAAYSAYWLLRCWTRPRELDFRQVVLAQVLVLQRLGARDTGQVQRARRQLEHRDVRCEPAWDIARSDRRDQRVDVIAT